MTPHEWHKTASQNLIAAINRDAGINTSDGVRKLVDAMFANMRDDVQSRPDMLANASLYTGMACSALSDYAKRLEEGER